MILSIQVITIIIIIILIYHFNDNKKKFNKYFPEQNLCIIKILLFAFMGCIIIHYIFPGKLEDIMNTTIIPIPEKIKCFVQLNNDDRYCYNDLAVKNEFSQYNANVDLWTIGHIFFWGLTGYICEFQPKFIFILSILWELFEIILGKLNLPFAGRITDVFMNMIGYLIGYTLKRG